MTPNKEDYLKLIFELGGVKRIIPNKQIVSGLNVSAASVSEMISKLEKEGYVSHKPYQGVQLTTLGHKNASLLVRKHRLWEVFLVEHLGYSWNSVHEEAEVLEHVSSEELTNRLEIFLDSPKFCPHGGIIPNNNQLIEEEELPNLTQIPIDTHIKVERVLDETELLDYLADINLELHQEYIVKKIGAYEGAITLVDLAQREYALSHKACENIFVSTL